MKHLRRVSQVIGKSLKNQKHGEVCTFFQSAENVLRIRLSNISKTRKSSNQSLEKKFYKMHVNLLEDGEFIKNEKNGKLRKVCPFSLKLRQSVWV